MAASFCLVIFRTDILASVVCLLALAGCVGAAADGDAALRPSTARPAGCDDEMRAFVALSQLAKRYGDGWRLFEPALEAMRDQILDCVDDGDPAPTSIRFTAPAAARRSDRAADRRAARPIP
jgi:hypothetical protein